MFGANTYGAQLICGRRRILNSNEAESPEMSGGRASILFPAGMSASHGTVSTVASSEDVVINDRLPMSRCSWGAACPGPQCGSSLTAA